MSESAHSNNRNITLTLSQEEAVSCNDRYIAVIAGPGSGKTRVLTERVVRLIEEGHIPSESILALSFSAKAANEVRKRLKERLGYQALKVSVKTFHSFGLDVIRQNADLLGYRNAPDILNDTDKYRILRKILQEKQRDNQNISLANIQRYAQEISSIKGGISSCNMQILPIVEKYNAELRRGNYLDFDDMICLCRKLLMENKPIRVSYQEKYAHILVDEVQDLNAYQTDIIRRLVGKNTSLFVVGDDDQCIYEWRGAIPDFLKGLASNNAFHTIHLDDNFRSERAIVTASAAFIDRNANRIKKCIRSKKLTKENAKPSATTFAYRLQDAEAEASFIAQTIKKETLNGTRSYNDFAILIRNHSQSEEIKKALAIEEIPYSYQTDDRAIYDEFLPVLRSVADIHNKSNINRAINYPIRIIDNFSYADLKDKYPCLEKMTVYEAFEWLHDNNCQFEDSDLFHARYNMLVSVHHQAHALSVSEIIQRLFDYYSTEKSHSHHINEKLAFIRNLIEMAADFDKGYTPDENRNTSGIIDFLDYLSLRTQDDSSDPDSLCVNLMTCHRSKGLEFPVVFIPGVQVKQSKEPSFINPEFIGTLDDLEAERRLFYVSMTRAIDCLYITCYGNPYAGFGPIVKKGFLAELPDIALSKISTENPNAESKQPYEDEIWKRPVE